MSAYQPWLHRYALLTSLTTLFLLLVGALVTSTGSSLAVPDWPLSFGQFFPPMVGGVLYEHGHRMVAGTVGLMTLGLAVWLSLKERRPFVRRLGWIALVAVVIQALLGGITVLLRLPPYVSVAHACLAQLFFCTLVAITLLTSRAWITGGPATIAAPASMRRHALALPVLFFFQLVLGASMRHLGAGLAIPDFPLAFGELVPPLADAAIAVHFAHRVGAFVVTVAALTFVTRVFRLGFDSDGLVAASGLLVSLIAIQLVLGALTIWLARPVWITVLHLVVGASCFATSVVLAMTATRVFRESPRREVVFRRAEVPA